MTHSILAPAAVLILWSLIMLVWVVVTRFPAFKSAGVDLANAPVGGRYSDLEAGMPASVNWKSHNYTHLMEQPTLFYAVTAILALAGAASSLNVTLAWAYVSFRILHSLWQSLVNSVPVRMVLFSLSTFCLFALAINAVRATVL